MEQSNELILIKKNEKILNTKTNTLIFTLNESHENLKVKVEKMTLLELLETLEPYFPELSNMVGLYFNYYLKKILFKKSEINYSEVHLIKSADQHLFKYKHNENDILNGYILKCSELNSYANAIVVFENQGESEFTLLDLIGTLSAFLETFNK